jgi:hypothetical protein
MAVPSSGAITMLGIAQERKYGLYGFGTISFPITMFDLLNGGGSNGFPALNACPQFSTPSYSMSGWYGYNQTASCGSCDAVLLRFHPLHHQSFVRVRNSSLITQKHQAMLLGRTALLYIVMRSALTRQHPVGTQMVNRLHSGLARCGQSLILVDDKK